MEIGYLSPRVSCYMQVTRVQRVGSPQTSQASQMQCPLYAIPLYSSKGYSKSCNVPNDANDIHRHVVLLLYTCVSRYIIYVPNVVDYYLQSPTPTTVLLRYTPVPRLHRQLLQQSMIN